MKTGGPMVLHYMPKLAAEFFLYEPDIAEYTQMHAAPGAGPDAAGDRVKERPQPTSGSFTTCRPPARCKTGETVLPGE